MLQKRIVETGVHWVHVDARPDTGTHKIENRETRFKETQRGASGSRPRRLFCCRSGWCLAEHPAAASYARSYGIFKDVWRCLALRGEMDADGSGPERVGARYEGA